MSKTKVQFVIIIRQHPWVTHDSAESVRSTSLLNSVFQAKTCYWLVTHALKCRPQTWSNTWLYWGGGSSGNICLSWRVLPAVLGCGFQPSSFAGNCLWHWKKGWQGKEEDEITAGELLWLSVHRAQWLKVNLEFCAPSDCPGVFFLTSNIQLCPLQTGIKNFFLNLLLAVCNFGFRLSAAASKAFFFFFFCQWCLTLSLWAYIHMLKWIQHTRWCAFTGLVLIWTSSRRQRWSRLCGLFKKKKKALIPFLKMTKLHQTDLLSHMTVLVNKSALCKSSYSNILEVLTLQWAVWLNAQLRLQCIDILLSVVGDVTL